MTHVARLALASTTLAVPIWAGAVPAIQSPQAYTDLVGPNPYVTSGWFLGLGATDITPAGSGLTVQAINVNPGNPDWDYAVPATPSPVFPRGYFALVPYTGQGGSWLIRATDSSGTSEVMTHQLDDIRALPLVAGLSTSGDLLNPTVHWTGLDPLTYPSFCVSSGCVTGFDFFNYRVIVRDTTGAILYQSANLPTNQPTVWTLTGVLAPDTDYLIGLRLNMSELEPSGFPAILENRSTAYLAYSTRPVPEPSAYALLVAGLGLLAVRGRRRFRGVNAPAPLR